MVQLPGPLSRWCARRRTAWVAGGPGTEQPIETSIGADEAILKASEDRLRRTDFAGRIATVLSELNLREGRVFAIRGGWGFGKSSLKNLIIECLDARSARKDWLDFNPWQWGDGDAIARALFIQIADRLGGAHSNAALARAEALRKYGAILTGASAPLKEGRDGSYLVSTVLTHTAIIGTASAVGFSLPTGAKILGGLAGLAALLSLGGRLLSYFGYDRRGDSLDKVRESLERRLRELERPLIVFVDDIDRLEPEQIRMVFRQVKANANLPNIVFVLLFQSSIVERALDPVADGDGRAFLEKVVQTSFDSPAVPVSTVHKIFGEELSKLAEPYATEANGFSQTRWGNVFVGCIQPMLHSIRDVRRLISSIAVHIPLQVAGDVFEVNIIDFLLLEALRVFEPSLHEALFRERGLVLQTGRYSNDRMQDENKAAAEQLLSIASEKRRTVTRDALKELFPQLEWAYGGMHYANGFQRNWIEAKRVCTERYFPRYFELQTAVGEISERQFIEFLEATAEKNRLKATIADIETRKLLPSLVARLDESVDRLPEENATVLLPEMFTIAQKLSSSSITDPFSSPWVSAWRSTSWFLKRIPAETRGSLAVDALRQTEALSVAAILIHLSDPADREEGQTGEFDPPLDLDTVEMMKAEWLRLIRHRASRENALISEPDLISLLYRWKDYAASSEEPREWVAMAIRTDEGFARIATRMMSRGTVQSAGDRVATPRHSFKKSTIDDFVGIDVAKARCDAIDAAKFPEDREALQTLQYFLDVWLGLREGHPFDF